MEDKTKRIITLQVHENHGLFRIHSDNDIGESFRYERDHILKTKMDERHHGYGLKRIHQTVEKHKGQMKRSVRMSFIRIF